MRVELDWNLCLGSGLCLTAAQRAFTLVPTAAGPRAVLCDPTAPEAEILAAARACPTLAIRLSDETGPIYPPAGTIG